MLPELTPPTEPRKFTPEKIEGGRKQRKEKNTGKKNEKRLVRGGSPGEPAMTAVGKISKKREEEKRREKGGQQ